MLVPDVGRRVAVFVAAAAGVVRELEARDGFGVEDDVGAPQRGARQHDVAAVADIVLLVHVGPLLVAEDHGAGGDGGLRIVDASVDAVVTAVVLAAVALAVAEQVGWRRVLLLRESAFSVEELGEVQPAAPLQRYNEEVVALARPPDGRVGDQLEPCPRAVLRA